MGWNSKDYLMHHGIKGQRWGIRRFQNKDGTLTAAGRKRRQTLDLATKYAEQKASSSRQNASDFDNDPKEYKSKYMTKGGEERWIKDMYGSVKNLKDIEEPDDPIKFAKQQIKSDYQDSVKYSKMMTDSYRDEAAKWDKLADKFRNTKVSDISRKDYKEAQKYADKVLKKSKLKTAAKISLGAAATYVYVDHLLGGPLSQKIQKTAYSVQSNKSRHDDPFKGYKIEKKVR